MVALRYCSTPREKLLPRESRGVAPRQAGGAKGSIGASDAGRGGTSEHSPRRLALWGLSLRIRRKQEQGGGLRVRDKIYDNHVRKIRTTWRCTTDLSNFACLKKNTNEMRALAQEPRPRLSHPILVGAKSASNRHSLHTFNLGGANRDTPPSFAWYATIPITHLEQHGRGLAPPRGLRFFPAPRLRRSSVAPHDRRELLSRRQVVRGQVGLELEDGQGLVQLPVLQEVRHQLKQQAPCS